MRAIKCALFLIAFATQPFASALDIISAFAGTGKPGDSGDGGPALTAQFLNPDTIAFDAAGNLYVCDRDANRIRKITRAGIITTIAGDGTAGFAGDGGPAVAAKINGPRGLAIDSRGDIYFLDNENFRIRRIDIAGNISTVAGNGTQGSFPDGPALSTGLVNNLRALAISPSGELYFVHDAKIRKIDALGNIVTVAGADNSGFGGDGGPALNALFSRMVMAFDGAGNLIICDSDNNRIRRIDAVTNIVTTIAGNGTAGFAGDGGPAIDATLGLPGDGIALDKAGNIYFGDYSSSDREPRIRKIDTNGNISTIAGYGAVGTTGDGGPALKAKLYGIKSIAFDAAGDLYFAEYIDMGDGMNHVPISARIRRVSFNNPDFVENPDNGVAVEVASRNAGLLELAVNVESLNRATFDVSTFFDDIPTRSAISTGLRPTHQFTQAGIFIATSTATDQATGTPSGKMRKTLAIGRNDTGESALIAAPPASRSIEAFNLKGKFIFNGSKTDVVTFSGEIELPMGLDLTSQQVAVSAGNITDTVNMDAKGKAVLPSAQTRISKMSIKYPKPLMGTLTGTGQRAKVSFTLSLANMVQAGFDTEGITPNARTQNPTAKSFSRAIQLALLVGGVTYEIKAPVAYKISSQGDAGQIQGRAGK